MTEKEELRVSVDFSGGAELLFGNERHLDLLLPLNCEQNWNLKQLINFLKTNHLKERPELFVSGDSVRPGILVLVNETDWELLGDISYELKQNDQILFISTLHGG